MTKEIKSNDARTRYIVDEAKKTFGFETDEQALRYAHSLLQQAVIVHNNGGSLAQVFNGIVVNIHPDPENRAFVAADQDNASVTADRLASDLEKIAPPELAPIIKGIFQLKLGK